MVHAALVSALLVLPRNEVAQRRMQSAVIVEGHPVHHRQPRPAHRRTHVPALHSLLKLMNAILAALVAVEYQTSWWLAALPCHGQPVPALVGIFNKAKNSTFPNQPHRGNTLKGMAPL